MKLEMSSNEAYKRVYFLNFKEKEKPAVSV